MKNKTRLFRKLFSKIKYIIKSLNTIFYSKLMFIEKLKIGLKLFRNRVFYSQFHEDMYLFKNYFNVLKGGIYCEIGAIDGIRFSNTKFFEDHLSWTGFLIEPFPSMYEKLKLNRPNSTNLNYAISEKEGFVEMFVNNEKNAVSSVVNNTPNDFFKKHHSGTNSQIIKVKSLPLNKIINKNNCPKIDFFSIDVEGSELELLKTFDWNIRVKVFLIEFNKYSAERHESIRELLRENGYKFREKFSINEIWVS